MNLINTVFVLQGVKNKFFVNTANAGKGLLSVVIDGPSKVQITCEERPDGYEFSYVPTLPGDYRISIKYGGNFDIFGSPFVVGLRLMCYEVLRTLEL